MIDQESEFILKHEVMNPSEGLEKMMGKIPGLLIAELGKLKTLPSEIHIHSDRLNDLLAPMMNELPVRILLKRNLKKLEMVKEGVMEFFMNRR
jgi:hypothetical protein